MQATRVTVIFRGHVQGVGFRFTALRVAEDFTIAGYVRNLRDGTVGVVAEGERTELERFLDALKNSMSGYIGDTKEEWSPATGEFRGFTVRY
jgi:acylphosphatase